MKKCFVLFFALVLLCLSFALPALAEGGGQPLVSDGAGLLTVAEYDNLSARLAAIGEKYGMSLVVLTVQNLGDKTPQAYADDYYDYNGYLPDGALLLVAMDSRDVYISTRGRAIHLLNDSVIQQVLDHVQPLLSEAKYPAAFEEFAWQMDLFLNDSALSAGNVIIVILLSLVISLAVVLVMKYKMKSVRPQRQARGYVTNHALTAQSDLFLYSHVTRTEKPQNTSSGSSTHTSSSGATHGGGGRKF